MESLRKNNESLQSRLTEQSQELAKLTAELKTVKANVCFFDFHSCMICGQWLMIATVNPLSTLLSNVTATPSLRKSRLLDLDKWRLHYVHLHLVGALRGVCVCVCVCVCV